MRRADFRAATFFVLAAALLLSGAALSEEPPVTAYHEGEFVLHDFKFRSGETLPELRLHYTTLGMAHRDGRGHIDNAVLVLHGTGGDASSSFRTASATANPRSRAMVSCTLSALRL
jgi:homoserine acetyltransferase